jgi:hypothetical protein
LPRRRTRAAAKKHLGCHRKQTPQTSGNANRKPELAESLHSKKLAQQKQRTPPTTDSFPVP